MLKPWLNEGLLLSSGTNIKIEQVTVYKHNVQDIHRRNNNVFSLSGTKWQNRRKLFANNFHFKTLDMYNNSINKNSRILVKKLLMASANNKQISNVIKYVRLCSLDIIGGNY